MSIAAAGEDSLEWFQRFGDVPRIDYPVPAGVDPRTLKGCGLKPEIHRPKGMPSSLWWIHSMIATAQPQPPQPISVRPRI
jgi:hypothetical protein